jgi:putative endonuclease
MEKSYFVYILTNLHNTTTYIGVTNDLGRRIYEHKNGLYKGFTKKYKLTKLIYAEQFQDITEAIHREKCLKKWKRDWKVALVNEANPEWVDLSENINI